MIDLATPARSRNITSYYSAESTDKQAMY